MNKLRKILGILALTAVLLSGCGGADTTEPQQPDPAPAGTGIEENTPQAEETPAAGISFEGTDLEGNAVTSDVFAQSKLTMVNVWATYCNPCLSEMPALGELAGEYASEEFQIIGIISDVLDETDRGLSENSAMQTGADQELAASLVEQTGANYTHLLLNESLYYALLTDVYAVPTTFFVDANGMIVDTVVGAMDQSAWEEKINALLEKR